MQVSWKTLPEKKGNNYSERKQNLEGNVPHLYNVYSGNSVVKNKLYNGTTIEVGLLNGVQHRFKGDVIKDIRDPDRWAMMISGTLNGHYAFFRGADRITENVFRFVNPSGGTVKLYGTRGKTVENDGLEARGYGRWETPIAYRPACRQAGSRLLPF